MTIRIASLLAFTAALALGPPTAVAGAGGTGTPATTSTLLPGIDDAVPAPVTTTSDDGLTTTDGIRSLSIDRATDLPDAGMTLAVSGSGYDEAKGVYVALCVVPQRDHPPTPCGGGADIEGTTGSSTWISSNPPPYGRGLAVPYGAGGTFQASIHVSPLIADGVDCRIVQCAIVSRNDHVRSADRSQDLLVPIRFAGSNPVHAPPTTTTGPNTTETTVAVTSLAPATDGTTTTTVEAAASGGGGSSSAAVVAGGAVVLLVVAGGLALARRRKLEESGA